MLCPFELRTHANRKRRPTTRKYNTGCADTPNDLWTTAVDSRLRPHAFIHNSSRLCIKALGHNSLSRRKSALAHKTRFLTLGEERRITVYLLQEFLHVVETPRRDALFPISTAPTTTNKNKKNDSGSAVTLAASRNNACMHHAIAPVRHSGMPLVLCHAPSARGTG